MCALATCYWIGCSAHNCMSRAIQALRLNDELARLVAQAQRAGRRPYVIPVGASDAVGSLGYVNCATELLQQCATAGIEPSHVIVATGSAGTHAGLLVGLRLREVRSKSSASR